MKTLEVPESEYIQMKAELEFLKKSVSENMKLNDSAIRRSMQKKVDEMNRFSMSILIVGFLTMCIMPSVFHRFSFYHISDAFIIASELMLLFCMIATVVIHSSVRHLDFAHESLVEVATRISRFKRQYVLWPRIGIPMVTLWLGWFLYEIYTGMSHNSEFIFLCSGVLCGAVLGGSIGWCNNRKIIRKADEVLREAKRITEECQG